MTLTEILKVTEIISSLASKKPGNWSQDERRNYESVMRVLDKEIKRRKSAQMTTKKPKRCGARKKKRITLHCSVCGEGIKGSSVLTRRGTLCISCGENAGCFDRFKSDD